MQWVPATLPPRQFRLVGYDAFAKKLVETDGVGARKGQEAYQTVTKR